MTPNERVTVGRGDVNPHGIPVANPHEAEQPLDEERLAEDIADIADVGRCRACPALMLWVVDANTGGRQCLDPEPDLDRGNVALIGAGRCVTFGAAHARVLRWFGYRLHLSHFVTCPERDRFKKGT